MTAAVILTHLALVVAALVFAVAAGVPLGVVCHFYPGARRVILRVVDFIQTTPALALLGFIMITPLGAGKPVTARRIYAYLWIGSGLHCGRAGFSVRLLCAGLPPPLPRLPQSGFP